MHIGIVGPIHIPSIKTNIKTDTSNWIKGMGGTPVNHQINALLEEGHNVSVFSLSPEVNSGDAFEWHQNNLSIYVGPYRKRARHRCIDLFFKERSFIKTAILKSKPDILHAHWQYEWAWAALETKIPTIVTCHDSPLKVLKIEKNIYRFVRLIMAYIVLKKAKYLSAVSPYTASSIKKIARKNVVVIPNFEPDSVFKLNIKSLSEKQSVNALRVAMVNNGFHGLKNVAQGIRAFVAFQEKNPKAELYLYGERNGENEDAFIWCKQKGIEGNIFFKGGMGFNDFVKELAKSDILLHTSLEESCSMAVIEAFALGIPVVGGDKSGGLPWMIENGCGCLVKIKDTNSIVNGLQYLSQPVILKSYSKNARDLALKKFSQNAVMKQYYDYYRLVLDHV